MSPRQASVVATTTATIATSARSVLNLTHVSQAVGALLKQLRLLAELDRADDFYTDSISQIAMPIRTRVG